MPCASGGWLCVQQEGLAAFRDIGHPCGRCPTPTQGVWPTLVARRGQIIDTIVAERQRQKRLIETRLRKSIARLLAALQKELSALETDTALVAVARKLLRILNAIARDRRTWQEVKHAPPSI